MCGKGLLKRLAPFFAAFALGLFVASFSVSVGLPNVRFTRGIRKHQEYHRQIEFEMQRLREENSRLKIEVIKNQTQPDAASSGELLNDLVPPPATLAPLAERQR